MMINGKLKDLMPVFVVSLPISLLFPFYSAPLLLGGVVQFYVLEEWAHHCMHYYNFRNRYFRHIKKYHLYHHTSKGMHHGYGITSAFWDVVCASRFPPEVRQHLFGPKSATVRANTAPSEQSAA
jgi:sterol desaturase/sphingolipid hydroxylase (fatty acid hydroxylase superfamily)